MLQEAQKYQYERIKIRLTTGYFVNIEDIDIISCSIMDLQTICLIFETLPAELASELEFPDNRYVVKEDFAIDNETFSLSYNILSASLRFNAPVLYIKASHSSR